MILSGISDLAQSLMLRRQGSDLQSRLSQLTQELSSGKTSDLAKTTRGNFDAVAGLAADIRVAEAYKTARSDVDLKITTLQVSLESLGEASSGYGARLLSAATIEQKTEVDAIISSAEERFRGVVSTLNSQLGDQFLFSGISSSSAAMADPDTMLADLRTAAGAATDAASLSVIVDDWFDAAGGGFETVGYTGGDAVTTGVSISTSRSVSVEIRAQDEVFRSMLKGLATAVLVSEGAISTDPEGEFSLLREAAETLVSSETAIVRRQAELGAIQEEVEREETAANVEVIELQKAFNSIVNVDQFDVASELQTVQTQIETLYLLTARTSQLRLSDYLR